MKNDATEQPLKDFSIKNLSQGTLKINANSNILGVVVTSTERENKTLGIWNNKANA